MIQMQNTSLGTLLYVPTLKTLSCTTGASRPKRVVMGNNNHFCPGPVCRPPAKTSAESSHGAHICVVFLIKVHIPFSNVSFLLLRQHKQTRRVQNNQKYIGDPKPTRLDSFQFFRAVLPSFFPTLALPYLHALNSVCMNCYYWLLWLIGFSQWLRAVWLLWHGFADDSIYTHQCNDTNLSGSLRLF